MGIFRKLKLSKSVIIYILTAFLVMQMGRLDSFAKNFATEDLVMDYSATAHINRRLEEIDSKSKNGQSAANDRLYSQTMDTFTDHLQLVSPVEDCNKGRSNVNPKTLYDLYKTKNGEPLKTEQICTIPKQDIKTEFTQKPKMTIQIPDNKTLAKAPQEIRDMFPNGVPKGGVTAMLEMENPEEIIKVQESAALDITKSQSEIENEKNKKPRPRFKFTGYWQNDNFVPGVPGNDTGDTTNQLLKVSQYGNEKLNIGFSARSQLFSKNYGGLRQKTIDLVELEAIFQMPNVEMGVFNVTVDGSIGWTQLSSKSRQGFGYASHLQAALHRSLDRTSLGAPIYETAYFEKGDGINIGKSGYYVQMFLSTSETFRNKYCYLKVELAGGIKASQLTHASSATAKARAEIGVNTGANSSLYVDTVTSVTQFVNGIRLVENSVGAGWRYGDGRIGVDVTKTTGSIGYVPPVVQDDPNNQDLKGSITVEIPFDLYFKDKK